MYDPQQYTLLNWFRLLYLQLWLCTLITLDMRLETSSHAVYSVPKTRKLFDLVKDRSIFSFPMSLHPLLISCLSQGQLLLQIFSLSMNLMFFLLQPLSNFSTKQTLPFILYPAQMSPFPRAPWEKILSLHSY